MASIASMHVLLWLALLFCLCFSIGLIAPVGGIGGGVLFVPLATAFLPFSVDFIRGTGLLLALTSALSSSPFLIRRGLTNLRIAAPLATVSISTTIAGSVVGLWFTNSLIRGESYFVVVLGILLLFIFGAMVSRKREDKDGGGRAATGNNGPEGSDIGGLADRGGGGRKEHFSLRLGLRGSWHEPTLQKTVEYGASHLAYGMLLFGVVGFISGMFGLGAGWASVPVLNLVMGIPIKAATATSMGIIVFNSGAATWVYLARGAILPLICAPSVVGMSIGSRIGAKIAARAKPLAVRYVVLGIMLCAAVVNILKGLRGLGAL
jgi:uncharacterized membrane protein YfcA